MSKRLYDRLGEVRKELSITYETWAEQAGMNPKSFDVLRSKMNKGSAARFNTLKRITPDSYIPLLLVDVETDKKVNLGNKQILWGKDFNQEEYISKVFSLCRTLKNGFSKTKLAKLSNISNVTYNSLENKLIIPSTNKIESIAGNLNLEVDYLVKKTVRKKNQIEDINYKPVIDSINDLLLKHSVILDYKKAEELRGQIREVREINSMQFVIDDINEFLKPRAGELNIRKAQKFLKEFRQVEEKVNKLVGKIGIARNMQKKGKV